MTHAQGRHDVMEDVESGRGGHTQGRMHGMEIWGRCFASRGKRRRRERWCTLRAGKKGGGEGEVGGKSDAYTRAPEGVIVGGVGANERHFLSRRRHPPLLFFPPTLLPGDGESCQGREGARAFPARRENAEIPARHERSEGREGRYLYFMGGDFNLRGDLAGTIQVGFVTQEKHAVKKKTS